MTPSPTPLPPTSRRHLLCLLGATASAWGLAATAATATTAGNTSPNEDAVRQFWQQQLPTPGGQPQALAHYRGRPLLVNFWATWCAPCVREMPLLDSFAQRSAGRVQVLGVAADHAAKVQQWLQRQPMRFPIVVAGMGGISITRGLGNIAGSLPFTVLFDSTGTIHARKIGLLTPQELDGWLHAVSP